jgi:hypothetical protein
MDERSEMTATIARIGGGRRRGGTDVRVLAGRVWDRWARTPAQRRRLTRIALIGGPVAAALVGAGGWFLFGPMRRPDYEKDSLRRVFTYTLLTDEFNKLPVEKRLELVGIIVRRVKSMSAGDSALVAAFAAGIAGAAREQLEENASKLAIDTWYMYAEHYDEVPPEDRDAYLDRVALELMKMGETLSGEVNDDTDAERLAEAREQARRDQDMLRSGRGPSTRALARVHQILRDDVGPHATGAQRSRGMLMMRDMVRRMRGESVGGPR